MIPFCRTVKEAEVVTGIMAEEGLVKKRRLQDLAYG